MTGLMWGLLGPEKLVSERRTRTLGVGACIRSFNDLAVPGLGGVWFGKQLFLATLGVAVAEQAREKGKGNVQNIETTNAIEALACWLALKSNDWKPDSRLRGASKMHGKENLSFAVVRKRGFYVTIPMRMSTVQPLSALGLVETDGSRFNAFKCSNYGRKFIEECCADYNPCHYNKSISAFLVDWILRDVKDPRNDKLSQALSPLVSMTTYECEILKERLIQGGDRESAEDKKRRHAALQWVESLRNNSKQALEWENKPNEIDESHWRDLHAGALFLGTRNTAIQVLDQLEKHIGNLKEPRFSLDDSQGIPDDIEKKIKDLRNRAKDFIDKNHGDELANAFCGECVKEKDMDLLASLVRRDERVLRLDGRIVLHGPAFRGSQTKESDAGPLSAEEANSADAILQSPPRWSEGISPRIYNLFLLNLDMQGELSKWFAETTPADAGDEQ